MTDDINRTKGTFGDPNNPMSFLNALQDHVTQGIQEISGITNILEGKQEQPKMFEKPSEEPGVSLFNEQLKQDA